ncbi:MAG: ATP-binding protein [Thermoanaerobaculia bacterium]|nr:ATP-binding protein [Thermoanaerobaculia bacterium]
MKPRWPWAGLEAPGAKVSLLLLLALLAVNGAAVTGLLTARDAAREVALEDLRLQTLAQARSLEASLATLRGDLIFLTQAPPLGQGLEAFESPDPAVRRWSRRDVEGALLLFLETHGALERLVVRDTAGQAQIAAGRRGGAPVLLRVETLAAAATSLHESWWPLGGTLTDQGRLEVGLDPQRLLAAAAPEFRGELRLEAGASANSGVVAAPVTDALWSPPVAWRLQIPLDRAALPPTFEVLAKRYRRTVALNLAIIASSLPLGALAFRQIRRAARLQVENEGQAKLRALEQQVRHSERLASLGRLAAGLAHEINNPLGGMSNYLTLLEEDLRAGRTDEALGLAERVREGLERIAKVTRGVLDFALPAGAPGEARRSRREVELGGIVAGVFELVAADPACRGVELVRSGSAVPLRVAGDPTTLGQLFFNLVLNACQAQPGGGRVEVDLGLTDSGLVRVTVADRGTGLAPEVAPRLFEPFVSTRGSTGLGLAVCWGIVGELGGNLYAANRPGGGAVFTVELPRYEEVGS